MTNKTTEALKLAEEALEELHYSSGTVKAVTLYKSALAAIREVLAEPDIEEMTLTQIASRHEPVKQKPVAWGEVVLREGDVTVSGYLYGQLPVGTKLYTAPQTYASLAALAARQMRDAAEALENDAKEHREVSYGLDCPPERTANWKHALNCEAAARLIREVLAEQSMAMILNDPHPPHRLCECTACLEYWTPLPDCDAFAASGKPIAETVKTYEQGYFDGYDAGLIFANSRVEPVKQEPVAWDLAEKVRRDLDRQSCPGVYMNIAVESIVKNYAAAIRGMK